MTTRELGFLLSGAGAGAVIAAVVAWRYLKKKLTGEDEDRPPIVVTNGSVLLTVEEEETPDAKGQTKKKKMRGKLKKKQEKGKTHPVKYAHEDADGNPPIRLVLKVSGSDNDGIFHVADGAGASFQTSQSSFDILPSSETQVLTIEFSRAPVQNKNDHTLELKQDERLLALSFLVAGAAERTTCEFKEADQDSARVEVRSRSLPLAS